MKKFFTFLTLFFISWSAFAQITITDADLTNGTYNWTSENEYILDGNVFLEEGGTLNIEAGTIVRGKLLPTTGDVTSALIITRGAKINAIGSANSPIIFTSELDDIAIVEPTLNENNNQTWGGIIILGNANVGEDGGTDFIEGIETNEARGQYGGTNDEDNSGTLKYVSIRHGGAVLGADNEINGLTLGGVGNGTTIDYVEIFANKDDGIEFFGGTVNATHIIAAFAGDDAFDYDEDWNGYCQFLFSLQGNIEGAGDNAIEYDGSEDSGSTTPVAGRIYNGTFIGSGGTNTNSDGLRLKSAGALQLWNSIIVQPSGYAFRVEDASLDALATSSAFANNIAFGYGTYVQDDEVLALTALVAGNTEMADPGLASITNVADGTLDPRPTNFNSLSYGGAAGHEEGVNTQYRGAFAYGSADELTWMHGWTALDSYGFLYATTGSTTSNENEIAEGLTMTVQPNPVSTNAIVKFELPNASDVTLQMIDFAGRTVYTENLGFRQAGANAINLNTANLANGTYLVTMRTNVGIITAKVIK